MANIELDLRAAQPEPPATIRERWRGLECEHVTLTPNIAFDYAWNGETNYLALHDLQLKDGLAFLENREPQRLLDLRNRMTFAPRGATIEGWSALTGARSSFTALFFKPDLLRAEFGNKAPGQPSRPALYFREPALLSAMQKLRAALRSQRAEPVEVETLALVCVLELARSTGVADYRAERGVGRLHQRIETKLRDYIRDNLQDAIALDALAEVAGLSRFHFIRAFKVSFGTTPHQFLIKQRVTRATELLIHSRLTLGEIATAAGFSSQQQFTSAFRTQTGMAPGQFRRRLL